MKRLLSLTAVLCLLLSLSGCQGTFTPEISFAGFALEEEIKQPIYLKPKESFTLPGVLVSYHAILDKKGAAETVEVAYNLQGTRTSAGDEKTRKIDSHLADLNLTINSSAPEAVTVNQSGVVTAVSPGHAEISITIDYKGNFAPQNSAEASAQNEPAAITIDFTVIIPPESVTAQESIELKSGKSANVEAMIFPGDTTSFSLTYQSSDESVATVDKDGNIKGISPGSATITTTAKGTVTDQIVTAQTTVTVKSPPPPKTASSQPKVPSSSSKSNSKNAGSASSALPGNASLKKGMTSAEYAKAYAMAEAVVKGMCQT